MALEAGIDAKKDTLCRYEGWEEPMEKFAALVAAAEREACAQECLMPVDEIQITDDCSEYVYKDYLDCAEAIRARGQL
jgi:hypothetical protein